MTSEHPTLLARLHAGQLVSATLALALAAAELATDQNTIDLAAEELAATLTEPDQYQSPT